MSKGGASDAEPSKTSPEQAGARTEAARASCAATAKMVHQRLIQASWAERRKTPGVSWTLCLAKRETSSDRCVIPAATNLRSKGEELGMGRDDDFRVFALFVPKSFGKPRTQYIHNQSKSFIILTNDFSRFTPTLNLLHPIPPLCSS